MFEEKVSFRYAKAIFEIALEAKIEDILFKDLQFVHKVFTNSPELLSMARKPIVAISKKKRIYEEIFQTKVSSLTLNSLLFLVDKSRDYLIQSIIAQYKKLYFLQKGFLPVEIYFATDVAEEVKQKIINKIEENTNKKIIPKITKNPQIIGGFILKINDWVYDSSLKNKLDSLYVELTKNSILETKKG